VLCINFNDGGRVVLQSLGCLQCESPFHDGTCVVDMLQEQDFVREGLSNGRKDILSGEGMDKKVCRAHRLGLWLELGPQCCCTLHCHVSCRQLTQE